MKTKSILFIIVLVCTGIVTVKAQNLTGKELNKADDVNALIESGIGLLFGAKNIEGEITKVKVTNDNATNTVVKVEYTGFENRWMAASILNAAKQAESAITSQPVQLKTGAQETELRLEFNKAVSTENVEAVFLKLLVCKKQSDVSGKVFYYQFNKTWKQQALSTPAEAKEPDYKKENLTLTLNPTPVGSAAQLKDANVNYLPTPSKMKKVQVNSNLYKTTITRKPMMLQAQSMQVYQPNKQEPAISQNPPSPANQQFRKIDKQMKVADPPKKEQQFLLAQPLLLDLQLDKEQIEKGAKGPGKTAIVLWDEIRTDVDFDYGDNQISNISTDIFPDQNENSGYYYYYPSSYNLVWDKDESYQLNILYGSGSDKGESGKVRMFAKLSPKIGTREKRMVEELVKEYASKYKLKYEKLVPIPLNEDPQIDLAGQLSSLYEIPSENVSAAVTGLFNPIDVAWPMSTQNADDLMVGLKEIDLNGTLKLVPQGETPQMNIPIKISLDNKDVLGRIELTKNSWRNKTWKNEMPFPVRLKYIHALFLNKEEKGGAKPYIYSWSLNNTEVPVLASVKYNATSVPRLVDTKAQKIWIEYAVPECTNCKDDIINGLTGGTTKAREQKIEITSYVKEDISAHVIEVTVRSLFADPKGEQIIELPSVKLKEDFETYTISPLYVPEGKSAEYEYKIKVVTDDDIFRSDWIYSNELSIDLNKSALKEELGKYPGED